MVRSVTRSGPKCRGCRGRAGTAAGNGGASGRNEMSLRHVGLPPRPDPMPHSSAERGRAHPSAPSRASRSCLASRSRGSLPTMRARSGNPLRLADRQDRIAVVDDRRRPSSRIRCRRRRFRRPRAAEAVPAGSSGRRRRRVTDAWPLWRDAHRTDAGKLDPARAARRSIRPAKKLLSPMNSPTKRLTGRL